MNVLHHDEALLEECWAYRNREQAAERFRARDQEPPSHEIASRQVDVTCSTCRSLRRRQRARKASAHRKRPDLPYPKGQCRLCLGDLPKGRRSWCSDECAEVWVGASTPNVMLAHLVGLHGEECWTCGARWTPGVRTDSWQDPDDRIAGPPWPLRVALEVDHVRPLWSLTDDERDDVRWWLPYNLQLLCPTCHKAKSSAEARARALVRRGVAVDVALRACAPAEPAPTLGV